MCQNGTRKLSKLPSSPKSWHYISTTKLYTQLTHIPKMYIPTTLCQNGTMEPSKLHPSPKCLHDIANTNIYLANWHIFQKYTFPQPCARRAQGNPPNYIHPPSVGMIYSILTYIFNCNIDMACYIQYKDIFQLTHNPKMFISSKCSKIFHNFSCQNSHILISQLKWVFLHVQISKVKFKKSKMKKFKFKFLKVKFFKVKFFQGQKSTFKFLKVKFFKVKFFQGQKSPFKFFQGQKSPFKFFQGQKSPEKYARQTQVKVKSGLVVPQVIHPCRWYCTGTLQSVPN